MWFFSLSLKNINLYFRGISFFYQMCNFWKHWNCIFEPLNGFLVNGFETVIWLIIYFLYHDSNSISNTGLWKWSFYSYEKSFLFIHYLFKIVDYGGCFVPFNNLCLFVISARWQNDKTIMVDFSPRNTGKTTER